MPDAARANRSTFRTYATEDGLTSLSGGCMLQDRTGYLFVCTEHGVFAYDGRRFVNLGPEQGLRAGGIIWGIAQASGGRIAVKYADELFVSDPAPSGSAPTTLMFRPAQHPGIALYEEWIDRLTPWRDGMVLLAGDTSVKVVVSGAGPAHVESLGYDQSELPLIKRPIGVFTVRGVLWETFEGGHICSADPGFVRCYGPSQGLGPGPWRALFAGPNGTVLARGPRSVATLDASAQRWSVADLPDQGSGYVSYPDSAGFVRAPDGRIVTEAKHGLDVLTSLGWRPLPVEDGAPAGIIGSVITDSGGDLWFQMIGKGLVRWVGYRHWQTLQPPDGLSEGLPWEAARAGGGSLWLATDTGVDELVQREGTLHVARVRPGASYALAAGRDGRLWMSTGAKGGAIVDPTSARSWPFESPPVTAIVMRPEGGAWLGTVKGLYYAAAPPKDGAPQITPVGNTQLEVADLANDGLGGLFYLASGRLHHLHADGGDFRVSGAWPSNGLEPIAIAVDAKGLIWVCGPGGLFQLTLDGDSVRSIETIPTELTRTNTVESVIVDHRGWVWVGTSAGISAFNGQRWVSADTDSGLVSNDVNQRGLHEDADGSIWISTSQGLSHLLDPQWLFADRPVAAVISSAMLGNKPLQNGTIPYTTEPLSVQFGTPTDSAVRSFLFRYQLSGVDSDWAESATGLARYPYVPPGHHVLTVVGYDELAHLTSPPQTLVIDVAYPWWRQWWAEALWVLLAVAAVAGVMRLRFQAIMARQAELRRYVAEATEKLAYQAAHDSLTGLLNRTEVEGRLAKTLSSGRANDEMVIALVDIDHFKKVNDSYGHLGGDDVLRTSGRMIANMLREGEYAGRYGGEEFLLVLSDVDGRGAERVLDLHHALRGNPFNAAGQVIRLTCSIGLAWARRGDNWESLIGRADDALYKAKANGRDKVVESGRVNKPAPEKLLVERRLRSSTL